MSTGMTVDAPLFVPAAVATAPVRSSGRRHTAGIGFAGRQVHAGRHWFA